MTDDIRDPDGATARIRRADRLVASSRRWHSGSMIALGVATIAWCAILGSIQHSRGKGFGLHDIILVVTPPLVINFLIAIRRRHPPVGSRWLKAFEYNVGNIYILVVIAASVVTMLVPHPVPAVFIGIIPALPCFYGAWKVRRR